MAKKLRIAIVTDIHYGRDSGSRLGTKAPRLMKKFTKAVKAYEPDFVIDMGDRISSSSPEEAKESLIELRKCFNAVAAPIHYLMGNHDLKYLSAKDNAFITGGREKSYSKDIKGHHIVFWNPCVDTSGKEGLVLPQEDLDWLEKDLSKTGKPSVVFSHVPLDGIDMTQEGGDILKRFYYSNAEDAQKILEKSGNVILAMGGHRHQNRQIEINGIHYISQQSLTNMYKKHYRIASGTFSFLEIDGEDIRLKIKGYPKKNHDLRAVTSPA